MTVSRLRPYATTVFAEMSALATRIGAVNLGQGFPDEDGPPKMLQAAQDAIAGGVNQYPPGPGSAPLRRAIAAQRRRHFGVDYDPETEVLVTVGATEAIAAAVLGLVEPGSEVLLIEPFYDSYSPVVAMAGAHRVTVPLVPDGRGFALDADALRRAVTPRTRALIINSPHNPTGAVLSATELAAIAEIAVAANLVVITDEVYEHLVFDHARHLPLAGFDGMAERTITISSAAKMFNCTGWKIGWACGPAELIAGVRAAKQYLSYVGGAPFQPAVALALDTEDAWVAALRNSLRARRDRLAAGLTEIASQCTTATARTSYAPTRARWVMTTAPNSVRRYRRKSGWPPSRCRRSATPPQDRPHNKPMCGTTWCASPSANETTPSTRQSGD